MNYIDFTTEQNINSIMGIISSTVQGAGRAKDELVMAVMQAFGATMMRSILAIGPALFVRTSKRTQDVYLGTMPLLPSSGITSLLREGPLQLSITTPPLHCWHNSKRPTVHTPRVKVAVGA